MGYVKLAGTQNRHENWTSEYVLERDAETDEVTKSVQVGVPVNLTKAEQDKLEGLGAVFEDSSKAEAEDYEENIEEAPVVGSDVARSAPLLGSSDQPNQNVESPGDSGAKTNK